MSRKKEVTIGITINLENYENLRLEVEGDVETREDVDDLIMFLDGMLARLGRGDPVTAERVDAYRRRVLTARPAEPQAPAAEPAPEAEVVETAAPEAKVVETVAPAAAEAAPAPRPEEKACPSPSVIETAIPPAPEHPKPPRIPKPPVKPAEESPAQPQPIPEQAQPQPIPEQAPPQPEPAKPPAAPSEDVCEMCGAEVTKSQAKLSQLFMSKTLCKKCMEQP
jgi:hypothetical protein